MKNCINCKSKTIKYGKTANSKQRYRCTICYKTFLLDYTYHAYNLHTNTFIIKYIKEGVGIRGIARLFAISTTTVLKRILSISKTLAKPIISFGKSYEVDEIRTFVKHRSV